MRLVDSTFLCYSVSFEPTRQRFDTILSPDFLAEVGAFLLWVYHWFFLSFREGGNRPETPMDKGLG